MIHINDFIEWAATHKHSIAEWEEADQHIAVAFANDTLTAMQNLIADICIHANADYESPAHLNAAIDTLNARITVALEEEAPNDHHV